MTEEGLLKEHLANWRSFTRIANGVYEGSKGSGWEAGTPSDKLGYIMAGLHETESANERVLKQYEAEHP